MQLRVTELNARDEITIRTQFSAYSFCVTDPVHCRGFLSGGLLGDQRHAAVFLGEISPANSQSGEFFRLQTGRRAVFLLAGKGLDRLTTSIIAEISLSETQAEEC